jgi:hypothetical protein
VLDRKQRLHPMEDANSVDGQNTDGNLRGALGGSGAAAPGMVGGTPRVRRWAISVGLLACMVGPVAHATYQPNVALRRYPDLT